MQLGSIKKEFGLIELNTLELGPIYKESRRHTCRNFCINAVD